MAKNNTKAKFGDVPQILRDYLNFMTVIKGKSESTVKEYYYDLRMFFRYLFAMNRSIGVDNIDTVSLDEFDENWLREITLSDLYEFMAYVNNEKSSNDNYRARKVASLKSFFNYLHIKIGFLESNPTAYLDSPKIKKRMPRYLTLEESIRFLKAIDGKFRERDLAMFVLFLNCGLRLSELVGINIRNIDFAKRTLRVIGKGNKERMVFLNDLCIDAINSYMAVRPNDIVKPEHKDALFISSRGTRISNRMVELLAKKYFQAADLDYELFSPHKLRHTAATLMFKEGNVDIRTLQELLGHASLSTTQIYTHIRNEDLRQAADKNPLSSLRIEHDNTNDE
ncbi:MAG: tyrosine recombinase XerC [Clostridia bacterium]|nr:tyrosine recombinase XerC [Clostridia bacterium]